MDYKEKVIALLNSQELSKEQKEKLENIFPELKESEDEGIRKEIITYLSTVEDKDLIPYESWIAWLEKQGKQKLADKYNITGIKSKHAEGKLGEMIKEMKSTDEVKPKFKVGDVVINKKSKDTVKIVQILHDSYCYSGWDGAATVHSDFSISEQDNWELVEPKPADKVEPKFKVGDIITNGKIIGKVDENENNKYHGWFGYNKDLSVHYADIPDVENWHLWTIQDAKDGDVLSYSDSRHTWLCIFKELKNQRCYDYCSYRNKDEIGFWPRSNWNYDKTLSYKPATKEQRDTLMKAMADAGYTFDFEKKELKKIEQKSTDKFEPKFKAGDKVLVDGKIYTIKLVNEDNYIVDENGRDVQEHFSYTKDWKLYEQNPAWSEEDERLCLCLIKDQKEALDEVRNDKYGHSEIISDLKEMYRERVDWLKSLKERIQPQPKQEWKQENTDDLTDFENAMMHIGGSFFGQHAGLDPNDTNAIKEQAKLLLELVPSKEWSEEDKEYLDDVIDSLREYEYNVPSLVVDKQILWLKSLKERVQPTKEQL